jgi:putative DNA primase/helicase
VGANVPRHGDLSWADLCEMLQVHAVRDSKESSPLWSPACYPEGATRAIANVETLSCLVLDFDSGCHWSEIEDAWEGLAYLVYTTYSHRGTHPKWRVVFPLVSPVPAADWPGVHAKLALQLGAGETDPSCKDSSRIYYLPCCPPEGELISQAFSVGGMALDHTVFPDLQDDPEPEQKKRKTDPSEHLPGDDYCKRTAWSEILEPAGWRLQHRVNGSGYWVRPGKRRGHGAIDGRGRAGQDLLFVFTSSAAPFEPNRCYTKFGAYAALHHGGDMRAAAKKLSELGYGIAKSKKAKDPKTPAEGIPEKKDSSPIDAFPWTELGNAERLLAAHGEDLRHCAVWNKWVTWDAARWAVDETKGAPVMQAAIRVIRDLKKRAKDLENKEAADFAKACESHRKFTAMVALARVAKGIAISPDDLDADGYKLNCANGTIDLRSGKLGPHTREDMISKIIPVRYDPEADCPLWIQFLEKIMDGNPGLMRYLWKAIGYTLTGNASEQVFFFLYGQGNNGKGTLIETLTHLMGDYARRLKTETLMVRANEGAGNDIAKLKGARFVATSEIQKGKRLNESLLKDLTGEDTVTARFLFAEEFDFRPQLKLWISGNHKPKIEGTDDGIWRRLRLIPFKVKISESEIDRALRTKLLFELPGILNWAIEGCKVWQSEGLGQPPEIAEAGESYREEMDPLKDFLEEQCELDANAKVRSSEIWKAYAAWAEAAGLYKGDERKFKAEMERKGFAWRRMTTGRFFEGLRLIEPDLSHIYRGSNDD